MTPDATTNTRETYHHGDLRDSLVAAGLDLAAASGPNAVVLREVTRRVGVSPNAAYRHFADREALLGAVCDAAQALLAAAIDESYRAVPDADAGTMARGHLRAVGASYVAFALDNSGLFRTAFSPSADLVRSVTPERAGPGGLTPFQFVNAALDEFVASGIMPAPRRPYAEFVAWSSVHGAAMLLIDGPLRVLDRTAADALTQHVIDVVEAGFTAP